MADLPRRRPALRALPDVEPDAARRRAADAERLRQRLLPGVLAGAVALAVRRLRPVRPAPPGVGRARRLLLLPGGRRPAVAGVDHGAPRLRRRVLGPLVHPHGAPGGVRVAPVGAGPGPPGGGRPPPQTGGGPGRRRRAVVAGRQSPVRLLRHAGRRRLHRRAARGPPGGRGAVEAGPRVRCGSGAGGGAGRAGAVADGVGGQPHPARARARSGGPRPPAGHHPGARSRRPGQPGRRGAPELQRRAAHGLALRRRGRGAVRRRRPGWRRGRRAAAAGATAAPLRGGGGDRPGVQRPAQPGALPRGARLRPVQGGVAVAVGAACVRPSPGRAGPAGRARRCAAGPGGRRRGVRRGRAGGACLVPHQPRRRRAEVSRRAGRGGPGGDRPCRGRGLAGAAVAQGGAGRRRRGRARRGRVPHAPLVPERRREGRLPRPGGDGDRRRAGRPAHPRGGADDVPAAGARPAHAVRVVRRPGAGPAVPPRLRPLPAPGRRLRRLRPALQRRPAPVGRHQAGVPAARRPRRAHGDRGPRGHHPGPVPAAEPRDRRRCTPGAPWGRRRSFPTPSR